MMASLQRRIFLFGSFGQALSYVVCMALVILGCAYFLGPETPRNLFIATVSGGFVATIPILIGSFPARFSIRAAGPATDAWLRDLDREIDQLGHARTDGEAIHYEKCLPRWMRWSEDSLDIVCQAGQIDVTGPLLAIRKVRRRLLADQV